MWAFHSLIKLGWVEFYLSKNVLRLPNQILTVTTQPVHLRIMSNSTQLQPNMAVELE